MLILRNMSRILDGINSPEDIKRLDAEELKELCSEIRTHMVDCCSRNPGHLASSLGAVELITGLHYVFDAPKDKIVFDVGHQAYAHKILTGRRDAFRSIRTKDGISGFPKMDESVYDAFGVGHASTSVSAALGLAQAAALSGSGAKVVALIGDGALTGGLAFEGLNNAGDSDTDILIILNDNNESIGPNTGGLHNYLLAISSNPAYNRFKDSVWHHLGATPARNFLQRWLKSFKSFLVKKTGGDLFESFGFRYFGPIDGNDIGQVVRSLRKLKDLRGPRILHCITVKGKGYPAAEADPEIWHAPGRFVPESGERIPVHYSASRYQDVFGTILCDLAAKDPKIVGITPAMASGCGMVSFAKAFPERFFDVGIEEEHAVTFSAGLAAGGMKPFCNIYSAFSQRAYDQIIHDVALQRLPVVICLDRAGLVGEDGATHHGAFDLAAYRSIPNTVIIAPRNETELKNALYTGSLIKEGPYIIRYPRGMGEGADWKNAKYTALVPGKGEKLRNGKDVAILCLGPLASNALDAAEALAAEGSTSPAVYDMRYLKPLDSDILEEVCRTYRTVVTLEDGCLKGGLLGAVAEYAASHAPGVRVLGIGIPDRFIPHGKQGEEREECGMDAESIAGKIKNLR